MGIKPAKRLSWTKIYTEHRLIKIKFNCNNSPLELISFFIYLRAWASEWPDHEKLIERLCLKIKKFKFQTKQSKKRNNIYNINDKWSNKFKASLLHACIKLKQKIHIYIFTYALEIIISKIKSCLLGQFTYLIFAHILQQIFIYLLIIE